MRKKCSTCRKPKEASKNFSVTKGGVYRASCKACVNEYTRKYYEDNRERYLATNHGKNRNQRLRKREFISSLKRKPCVDCQRTYPTYVMDFDHRNPEEKNGNLSDALVGGWSNKRILEEVRKCDVVCSNYHRIRSHNRSTDVSGGGAEVIH